MLEEIACRVLYRDALMIVLDKPAGLAVHRGPKGGSSLEDSFGALRFGLPNPPALAHRLDRETSGCLLLGRHRKALAQLGALFRQGRIAKTYWAVVAGGRLRTPARLICRWDDWMRAAAGGCAPIRRGALRSLAGRCWGVIPTRCSRPAA